ncbi:sec20 family protein [Tanacetum coccineum]
MAGSMLGHLAGRLDKRDYWVKGGLPLTLGFWPVVCVLPGCFVNGLRIPVFSDLWGLRSNLRNANLQAKANMRKAAQEERELLLGGGEESTARRRNLQTKAGMTSAAESITESLRRTRQMMVQEVERTGSTLMAFEESTGVLKKAESEYKGHRSLLGRTRNLLSTMKRQDVLDRIILIVGFTLFSLAVLYVVSKRIGILKLQRKVVGAIKAGMASGKAEVAINHLAQVDEVHEVPNVNFGLGQPMHDEL